MKTVQAYKIQFGLTPIKKIISESNNARKFIRDFNRGKNRPNKELTQHIRIIHHSHHKISKSFEKNKRIIQKLSPTAAKHITKKLKEFDERISTLPGTTSRKLVRCIELSFMVFEYSDLAEDYDNFGKELKMYLELINNASKQA